MRLKTTLLATACLAVAVAAAMPARATQMTYSSYSVLNNQNVTLNDKALNVAETAGSGQITLNVSGTPGGIIKSWCIDIADTLRSSGSFGTGTFLDGVLGNKINALVTHASPDLAKKSDSSSALQVAIWEAKYGSGLSVSAPANVSSLASTYLSNVATGVWTADPTVRVAVLSGGGANQDQAYLTSASPTAVPEPASVAALAAGLLGLGFVRRKWRA